jgi:hypothetical protein
MGMKLCQTPMRGQRSRNSQQSELLDILRDGTAELKLQTHTRRRAKGGQGARQAVIREYPGHAPEVPKRRQEQPEKRSCTFNITRELMQQVRKREEISEKIQKKIRSETTLHQDIQDAERELKSLRISTDSAEYILRHKEAAVSGL